MTGNDDSRESRLNRLDSLRQRANELEARRAGRQVGQDGLYQGDDNYRTLVNNLDVGIYRNTGGPQGRFLRANPAMVRLFGYGSVEEFLNARVADLYAHPEERALFIDELLKNGVVRNKQLLLRRKDGSQFWGSLTSTAAFGADGSLTWIDGMVQDVTELRRVEEELKQRNEKYTKAFRQTPVMVVISTLAEGRYLEVNEAFVRIMGFSKEEALGKTAHELGIWHDFADRDRIVAEVRQRGSSARNTIKFRTKGGDLRIGLFSAEAIQIDGQDCLISMVTDITESTLAMAALRESEEKYAKAFRQSPFWVLITTLKDGRYLEVNEAFLRSMGYTRQELLGRTTLETGLWVDPRMREVAVEEIKRTGSVGGMEVEFRGKGGQVRIMLFSSEEITLGGERCMVSVSVDITERKRAEKALRESEEKYRTLTQHMQDVAFLVQDGRIRHINDRILQMSGYTAQELIGKEFLEFIAPEYRPKVAEIHRRRLAGQDVPSEYEMEILAKDGGRVLVKSYVSMVPYEGGMAAMGTFRDITGIKHAEEEKARLQAQLQHAQKMEAIGTLASGIAHDFNNILQGVRGYLKLMEIHADKPELIVDYTKEIDGAVARATNLIQRMLAFGRKLEPKLLLVDLNTVVRQALKLLERTIPKMITIEVELGSSLHPIKGDTNQLEQIIINLANNAADAMPQGGRLLIQTENQTLDQYYCQQHLGSRPGDYVCLTISDTGSGMDQDLLPKIFDPFFTTKEVGQGSGLGLSIVYGIVQSHGGQVSCYSEKGVGSTFKLLFPVSTEQAAQEQKKAEALQEAVGGDETILVVDDEAVILDVVQEALTHFGYKVITAKNGEEALQIHAERSDEIDLTILDIGMPGMGGIKCLRELKARRPETKVVVASGYSLNGRLKDIKGQGAAGFLAKPYRTEELLAAVRSALNGES